MAYGGGYNAITGNVMFDNARRSPNGSGYDANDASEIVLSAVDNDAERHDLVTGNVFYNSDLDAGVAAVREYKYSGTTNPHRNVISGNNFYLQGRPGAAARVQLISNGTSTDQDNYGNE